MSSLSKRDIKVFIVLSMLAMSSAGVISNCCGVFFNALAEALSVKRGSVSFYITIQSIVGSVSALYFTRRMNQKNYKKIILWANVQASTCFCLMGRITSLYQLYILAVLIGMSLNCFHNAIINPLITSNFDKNVGKLASLIYVFSGIVGIILSPVLTHIIETFSYSYAYLVVGGLSFLFALPVQFIDLKVDFKDVEKPKGERSYSKSLFFGFMIMLCSFYIITAFPQHMIGYAGTRNIDSMKASYLLSAAMAGNVFFKPINGFISDKLGSVKATASIVFVNFVGLLMVLLTSNYIIMLLGCFLYGDNYSLTSFMQGLLSKDLFKDSYYTVFPRLIMAGSIVSAFSASLIGYCYDFTGSYNTVIYLILTVDIINFISLIYLSKKY